MQWVAWHIVLWWFILHGGIVFFQQIYTDGDSKTTHKAMMLDGMQTIEYGSNCPGTRMIGTSYPHSYNGLGQCVFSALDTQVCWMIRRFGEMMAACRALLTSTPRMSPAWWHLPWSRTGISFGHWASMPCDHAVYNVYTVYTHVFSDVFSWLSNAFVSKLAVAGAHGGSDTDLDRAQGLVDERGNQTLRGAFLCGPCWICWKFPHVYHARRRSWYPKTSSSQWHVPGCLRSCLAEMRTWMWSPTNRCSSQWQLQALWTFTTQIPAKLTWKLTTWQLEREIWTKHPLSVSTLLAVCVLEGLFDWTVDVAERLRFVEVHVFFSMW